MRSGCFRADRVYAFFVEWIPEDGLVAPARNTNTTSTSPTAAGGGPNQDKEGGDEGDLQGISEEDRQDLNTFVLLDTKQTLTLARGVQKVTTGGDDKVSFASSQLRYEYLRVCNGWLHCKADPMWSPFTALMIL